MVTIILLVLYPRLSLSYTYLDEVLTDFTRKQSDLRQAFASFDVRKTDPTLLAGISRHVYINKCASSIIFPLL